MDTFSTKDSEVVILTISDAFGNKKIAQNLRNYVNNNQLQLELPFIDSDLIWDGTLLIHFEQDLPAIEVVNNIINGCNANEIWFTDSKTLRLWWD